MSAEDVKQSLRNTPMGQLLLKYGFEPYDTESSARTVAERAAEEIASLNKDIEDIIDIWGPQVADYLEARRRFRSP